MAHEEQADTSGSPEVKVGTRTSDGAEAGTSAGTQPYPVPTEGLIFRPGLTFPKGLTNDGREEFVRLIDEDQSRLLRRFGQELTLLWVSLGLDGPETFGWDRVRAAYAAMLETRRREILDEARVTARTEGLQELVRVGDLPTTQAKQATRRWALGAIIGTVSTTTIAVLAVPDGNIWLKGGLVCASAIGTIIARPPRG